MDFTNTLNKKEQWREKKKSLKAQKKQTKTPTAIKQGQEDFG